MISALTSFFTSLWLYGVEYFAAWSCTVLLAFAAGVWISYFWRKGTAPTSRAVPQALGQLHAQLAQLQREQEAIKRVLCLDALTGLQNGRQLEQVALPSAMSACASSRHPLTLAFFDFDHFGAYNKAKGHDAGNALLIQGVRTAQTYLAQRRCTDQLFRFYTAGDEFAVLMPGADAARADDTLTLLRAHLRAVGISVSIGAVVLMPGQRLTAKALLAQADAAMRAVKNSKRGGPPNVRPAAETIEHTAPALQPVQLG